MNKNKIARGAAVVAFAAALAGCGGGSGSAVPTAATAPPVTVQSNSLTTYSVFVGQAGTQPSVDVQPLGVASTLTGAAPAANAYVVYPDNSVQRVDALGNFDVSQSSWALQNVNILLANPENQPTVDVFAVASNNPSPEELTVNAYGVGGSIVPAGNMIGVLDAATGSSADLAHLVVTPANVSMLDNRTKIFHVVGKDSNGALVQLAKAPVVWSVTRAAGCAAAAGRVRAVPGDAATVVYVPPTSGSVTANCPDQVVATLSSGSASHSGSGNAYFFDPATSASLAGTLKTAAGTPAANAVINLYGASAEAQKGSLLVQTDANGKFARLVPVSRILAPTASLTSDKTKAAFVAVTPASINPATAGAALGTQTWTMTAQAVSTAPKPQPPFAAIVRDANFYANAARESLPFGAPNAAGGFAPGSIEYVLSHPVANQTGSVTAGPYSGYAYRWDTTAKVATFTQPGSGNVKVLTVTTGAASVNGQTCAAGAACFTYSRKSGTALEIDGAWSQQLAGSSFNVTYVRNIYNGAHQTAGSPLYSNTLSVSQTVGTQTVNLTEQRFNAAGKSLGTLTVARVAGTGNALYTYSGTVHALSYKADGSTVAVDYSLTNGVENKDYSGAFGFAITASPSKNDVGDSAAFTINAPSPAGNLASGTVDGAGLTGLLSGHAAAFFIAPGGKVTLTKDASLGGNVITFTL